MSEILGVSLKAIQSFEQGWRRIPAHVERQTLFVLAMKMGSREQGFPRWKIRRCSARCGRSVQPGNLRLVISGWFINGTICQGKPQWVGVKKWFYAENVRSSLPSRSVGASLLEAEPFREEKIGLKEDPFGQFIAYDLKYSIEGL